MLQSGTIESSPRIGRLCVARAVRDGAFIIGVSAELDDLRVAAGLRSAGLKVVPYRGKSFGRVDDIARQLARQGCDAYLFWIDADTAAATRRIVFQLRKLRADVSILLWGDGVVDASALGAWVAGARTLAHANAAEVVHAIAPRTELTEALEGSCSPYLSGLAQAGDLLRLGLTVDQPEATLTAELAWARAQRLPSDSLISLHSRLLDAERLDAMCTTWSAQCPELKFRACASASPQAADDSRSRAEHAARLGMNGIVALSTGIYVDRDVGPGIVHLETATPCPSEVRARALDQLRDSMLLRSAAVLIGEPEVVASTADAYLATGEVGPRGWPRHLYSIRRRRASGSASARFHEGGGATRDFAYVPLSELRTTPPDGAAALIATLRTQEDAAELERLLQRFHQEGLIDVAPAACPVFFENTCRWIGAGGCSLNLLRRVAVEADGSLTACRDAGVVGQSGEAFEALTARVRRAQQVEEGLRACASCPVRDDCSKCLHLPAIWAGRYCELRRANPQARLFFELMDLPHLARGHVANQVWLSLRVSYTDLPACFYAGPTGRVRSGARPILVAVADQVLAWRRGERKLTRISTALATIAEGHWSGASEDDIARELTARFGVDPAVASDGLQRGLAQLRAGGLIDA